jgi:hypothetical protein
MRGLVLAVLVAIPLALVGWVRWAAVHDAPPEFVPPEAPKVEDPEPALRQLFTGALGGLAVRGEPAAYDEKSLFDAIDGAAPIFLERKFRRSLSVELATESGHELTCDVYDMTDVEHATSIFEKERSSQAKTPPDWPEALTGPMSLVFHQGRFYVKMTAFDAEAEAALPSLGHALREKMK